MKGEGRNTQVKGKVHVTKYNEIVRGKKRVQPGNSGQVNRTGEVHKGEEGK